MAPKRGGGKGLPLEEKKTFKKLYLSYFKTKGGKALSRLENYALYSKSKIKNKFFFGIYLTQFLPYSSFQLTRQPTQIKLQNALNYLLLLLLQFGVAFMS